MRLHGPLLPLRAIHTLGSIGGASAPLPLVEESHAALSKQQQQKTNRTSIRYTGSMSANRTKRCVCWLSKTSKIFHCFWKESRSLSSTRKLSIVPGELMKTTVIKSATRSQLSWTRAVEQAGNVVSLGPSSFMLSQSSTHGHLGEEHMPIDVSPLLFRTGCLLLAGK
jgi:hypothetical protein